MLPSFRHGSTVACMPSPGWSAACWPAVCPSPPVGRCSPPRSVPEMRISMSPMFPDLAAHPVGLSIVVPVYRGAATIGLRHARGAYVITMDDDLQNPPEEVVKLYNHARLGGWDVVYTRYAEKKHE